MKSATDLSTEILRELCAVLYLKKELEAPLGDYPLTEGFEPDVDTLIEKIIQASERLLSFVDPSGSTPAYGVDFRHEDRPSHWDFAPWFWGKASQIREAALSLAGSLDRDVTELEATAPSSLDVRKHLRGTIESELRWLESYARVIFEQLLESGLRVSRVKTP